jgi:hypothetical protein
MADLTGQPLSREERELIHFFRSLPPHQQLDILGTAEANFNASERMKQLAARHVERRLTEDKSEWH